MPMLPMSLVNGLLAAERFVDNVKRNKQAFQPPYQ